MPTDDPLEDILDATDRGPLDDDDELANAGPRLPLDWRGLLFLVVLLGGAWFLLDGMLDSWGERREATEIALFSPTPTVTPTPPVSATLPPLHLALTASGSQFAALYTPVPTGTLSPTATPQPLAAASSYIAELRMREALGTGLVNALVWSRANVFAEPRLAVGGEYGIVLHDANSTALPVTARWPSESPITQLIDLGDGRLVSGDIDGRIQVWAPSIRLDGDAFLETPPLGGPVDRLALSPGFTRLAVVIGHRIHLVNLLDASVVGVLTRNPENVTGDPLVGMIFREGERLVTVHAQHLCEWDTEEVRLIGCRVQDRMSSHRVLLTTSLQSDAWAVMTMDGEVGLRRGDEDINLIPAGTSYLAGESMQFSVDGSLLAVGRNNGIYVFDTATGQQTQYIPGVFAQRMSFDLDNRWLGVISNMGTVQAFALDDGRLLGSNSGYTSPVSALATDHTGTRIAVGYLDGRVRQYALADDGIVSDELWAEGKICGLAFSHDANILGALIYPRWPADDDEERLHTLTTLDQHVQLIPVDDPRATIDSNPAEGAFIVAAVRLQHSTARLLSVGRYDPRWIRTNIIGNVRFSPDGGAVFAAIHDQAYGVYGVEDGELLTTVVVPDSGAPYVLSINYEQVITASDGVLYRIYLDPLAGPLLDFVNPDAVARLDLPVTAMTLSPDEWLLALAHPDGQVSILDTETLTLIGRFSSQSARVVSLPAPDELAQPFELMRFAPVEAGYRLITGGTDGIVRVWDLQIR